jgi:hypothetical protein
MKKTHLLLPLFLCFSIVSLSQVTANTKDTLNKNPPPPKDRNMFGHGIPRGLTINSDGLSEGYVMFAVPNSGSVYLINRKVK